MKVWITKYALTQGLFEVEVIDCGNGMVKDHEKFMSCYHGEGRDWHLTLESALARCEAMRAAKLESLEKQAAKIRALDFERMVKP